MAAKSVTFLHVADVHLGAPVRGLCRLTDEWTARLARAIPESFDRVVDVAIARAVDFVVLAGDTFDSSRASYAEHVRFFAALERLGEAEIPAYIVAGNHDPYSLWSRYIEQLPASACLLGAEGPEFHVHERDGEPVCIIAGRSYYNQAWPSDTGIADGISRENIPFPLQAAPHDDRARQATPHDDRARAPFLIGVMHTGLDIDATTAPADVADLLSRDVDYWACGHSHQRIVLPSADNPRIVFPGCIQGSDMKETGERGCYLVKLEEGSAAQLEFIPTSSVILEQVRVDVSVCPTLGNLVRLVASTLFRENARVHCDEMVLRIALVGATKLHRYLAKREVIEDLRKQINDSYPSFYCDALIDRTTDPRDAPLPARQRSTFASVVVDIASEQREREEAMVNYVQSEFVKRGIAVPNSLLRRIGTFNKGAELRVLDLLREEEE